MKKRKDLEQYEIGDSRKITVKVELEFEVLATQVRVENLHTVYQDQVAKDFVKNIVLPMKRDAKWYSSKHPFLGVKNYKLNYKVILK